MSEKTRTPFVLREQKESGASFRKIRASGKSAPKALAGIAAERISRSVRP
jgi:hypothetical protein